MYAAIEGNRKPVIAAVNGFALGGGMELVLCCDIVIANQFAKLGLPEIKLGLIPGGGGTQRSVAKLGRNRANLLLMTGAIVPASEFVDAGLVNEVVEAEQLMPRALELAAMIAAEPAAAIEGLKRLTAHAVSGDLAERPRHGARYPGRPLPQRDRAAARARIRREKRRAGQEGRANEGQASDTYRGLGWAHGALTVQRLGAMLAPVTFVLADGRQVSPLHIAPWADEPGSEALPGILRKLRGEWPCVPFGYSVPTEGWPDDWARVMGPPEPDEEVHGHSSNHDWTWLESDGHSLSLALDYPESSPVVRVERTVTPDPAAPAIDIEFSIVVRRACRLPIGLHPVFRLPAQAGAAELELGAFDHGRTYPNDVEPGVPLFAKDAVFADLTRRACARWRGCRRIAAASGGPRQRNCCRSRDSTVRSALANHAEGYRVRLSWQKEHFPSLLLWYSNRGRKASPWNGRHVAIGIEPICSPFGLGPATALADNPIARSGIPTALEFVPEQPFTTRYRIEAAPL